jgi:hypothetical protein
MSSNDETVSLEAFSMRNMGYRRRGMAAVWVVQLCESIEAVFRVGITVAYGENLIRRGSAVRRHRDGPREVCLVAIMRVRGRVRDLLGMLGIGPCV